MNNSFGCKSVLLNARFNATGVRLSVNQVIFTALPPDGKIHFAVLGERCSSPGAERELAIIYPAAVDGTLAFPQLRACIVLELQSRLLQDSSPFAVNLNRGFSLLMQK